MPFTVTVSDLHTRPNVGGQFHCRVVDSFSKPGSPFLSPWKLEVTWFTVGLIMCCAKCCLGFSIMREFSVLSEVWIEGKGKTRIYQNVI